jgi:hypothetical protein
MRTFGRLAAAVLGVAIDEVVTHWWGTDRASDGAHARRRAAAGGSVEQRRRARP